MVHSLLMPGVSCVQLCCRACAWAWHYVYLSSKCQLHLEACIVTHNHPLLQANVLAVEEGVPAPANVSGYSVTAVNQSFSYDGAVYWRVTLDYWGAKFDYLTFDDLASDTSQQGSQYLVRGSIAMASTTSMLAVKGQVCGSAVAQQSASEATQLTEV